MPQVAVRHLRSPGCPRPEVYPVGRSLCGAEESSAEVIKRTPLSKQRDKHIQSVLIEAAKLAPQHSADSAPVYERESRKGNANSATLAVARKLVAYLLAVDRGQRDFVSAVDHNSAVA